MWLLWSRSQEICAAPISPRMPFHSVLSRSVISPFFGRRTLDETAQHAGDGIGMRQFVRKAVQYFGLHVEAIGGRRNAVQPLGIDDLDFLDSSTNRSSERYRALPKLEIESPGLHAVGK